MGVKEPKDTAELIQLIFSAVVMNKRIKIIGSHSNLEDKNIIQISLRRHFSLVTVDIPSKSAWIEAGVTYTQLIQILDEKGLALDTAPSI